MSNTNIEERVKKIIVDMLGVKPEDVVPEASFVDDLGADSLDTVELVMALEEEFDIDCSHVPYKITKDGMFYWSEEQYGWQSIDSWLTEILSGKIKIIKKPILDEVDREYLSNIIKPFKTSAIFFEEAKIGANIPRIKSLSGFSDEVIEVFLKSRVNNICDNLLLDKPYPGIKSSTNNPLGKLLLTNLPNEEIGSKANFLEGVNSVDYTQGGLNLGDF